MSGLLETFNLNITFSYKPFSACISFLLHVISV